jgi:hypothetical protein
VTVVEQGTSCSFCQKAEADTKKLIGGQGGVFICDECVALCAEIVSAELGGSLGAVPRRVDPSVSGRTTLTGVMVPPLVVDEWMTTCLAAFGCRLIPPHSLEYEMLAVELESHSTFVAEVPDLEVAAARFRALGEFSEETSRDLPELRVVVFKSTDGNEAVLFQRKAE